MLPRPSSQRNQRELLPRPVRIFCAACGIILLLVLGVALVAYALLSATRS